jgi:Eukaryotic aspartyl protease
VVENTPVYCAELLTSFSESSSGLIVFGGVDMKKFIGDLITIDVQPDLQTNSFTSPSVLLSSIAVTSNGESKNITSSQQNATVLLNPGSAISYLPASMVSAIIKELTGKEPSAEDLSKDGALPVNCNASSTTTSLDFGLGHDGGPIIQVTMRNFVYVPENLQVSYTESDECEYLFGVGHNNDYVLGESFFRSAYVVYDLDNNKISMAQARLYWVSSNIVEIPKGPGGVASIMSSSNVIPNSSSTSTSTKATATTTSAPTPTTTASAQNGASGTMSSNNRRSIILLSVVISTTLTLGLALVL